MMKFSYTNLETCHNATGVVLVIDVIRAFTNAAFAFSRGAQAIYPVSTVEEALHFKAQVPNSLACGEVGGLPPEGFDFGNSPTETNTLDLDGCMIVQRTGAGTQGIVRSVKAETILAASLVVASATVTYVRSLEPDRVTFVITGQIEDGRGDEDLACAEYLEALLSGGQPDPAPYIERVYQSLDASFHLDPNLPQFPESDLDHCTKIDAFDFAMLVTKENRDPVMRIVRPTWHLIPDT
ncbi:MAG TPA: 2-phosphosulfolactate phosphatase [Anaerolineales bacterium]|nr:2-phosphosulfolactate phosphatase [Anaerolineales bacterium]HLO33867.1 2-phosphosulfolactate phosphatase [Anaerolineales bacterium]